jgi:branched-chain amino acid transport system permease protein
MHVEAIAHWITLHHGLVDAIGLDALLGLAAWIVLACGEVPLGTAGFAAIGAFVSVRLTAAWHWGAPWSQAGGAVGAALAAFVLGLFLIQRGRAQFAIGTLCFGAVASMTLRVPGASAGALGSSTVAVYAALAACTFAVWRLMRSRDGRAIAAIEQDESAASGLGIDAARYKHACFVASALIAGIAGVLSPLASGASNFAGAALGPARSIEALAFAVVGGSGAVGGPIAGAVLLGYVADAIPRVIGYRTVLDASLLVFCTLALPGGMWSAATALKRVFAATRGAAT